MIKASGRDRFGKPFIMLGFSHKNLDLLKEGKPVVIPLSEYGAEGHIVIMSGETEDAIKAEIEKHIAIGEVRDQRDDPVSDQ